MIKLSELKEEIADKIYNASDIDSAYTQGAAHAALDVIQKYVCIMEEGVKPEVGDKVLSKTNDHFESFTVVEVDKGYIKTTYMCGGFNAKAGEFETIKRADGRPVLTVEKEDKSK